MKCNFIPKNNNLLSFVLKRSPLSHILTGYKFANYVLLEIKPLDIDLEQIQGLVLKFKIYNISGKNEAVGMDLHVAEL